MKVWPVIEVPSVIVKTFTEVTILSTTVYICCFNGKTIQIERLFERHKTHAHTRISENSRVPSRFNGYSVLTDNISALSALNREFTVQEGAST